MSSVFNRFRPQPADETTTPEQTYFQNLDDFLKDFEKPLDPDIELPLLVFTDSNDSHFSEESKLCVICQSEFSVGEELNVLRCTHKYHAACLAPWL